MCRHVAYLGPAVSLAELLLDPPHSLERQSYQPAHQQHGKVNADGFGVGWYADWPGAPEEPARYRRGEPIWGDPVFRSLTRVVRSGAILAAIRSATPGLAEGDAVRLEAAAPMGEGRWLFSHNGRLDGWPDVAGELAAGLPAADLLRQGVLTDSTLLWALVAQRLDEGLSAAEALSSVVELAAKTCGGGLNMLLTDGHMITATVWGESLFGRELGDSAVLASEPYDDSPGWQPVADRSLVSAHAGEVSVSSIDTATAR